MTFCYRWIFPISYSLGCLLLLNTFKISDFDYKYIVLLILVFVFFFPLIYWYIGRRFHLLDVR
jgi:hypothetical protein